MNAFRENLAWAAGLFDGEGWASSARYNRKTGGMTATLSLGVGQAHREVLDRFRAALGFGSVTGPTKSRKTLMWSYRVHGFEKVQAVFAMLWPWLGEIKRAQVVKVLRDALAFRPRQKRRQFTRRQVEDIRSALAAKVSQSEIARRLDCNKSGINAIARGRAYREK